MTALHWSLVFLAISVGCLLLPAVILLFVTRGLTPWRNRKNG
jgi:hypothetical protein